MFEKNFVVKKYDVTSDKISQDYKGLLLADLHITSFFNKSMKDGLKFYLNNAVDNIDFVFVPGDIASFNYYLNAKKYDKLKFILSEISSLVDAPLYVSLGNHDIGIFFNDDRNGVLRKFEELGICSDIIPLNDKTITYNDEISISGGTWDNDMCCLKNNEINLSILKKKLSMLNCYDEKYNIALIHDPLSLYCSVNDLGKELEKFDLILSGHQHGGFISYKQMEKNNDGYGFSEYFKIFDYKLKVPCCYGKYKLTPSTDLIVTEGIRRFNGYYPSFLYTTPFVTEISFSSKVRSR